MIAAGILIVIALIIIAAELTNPFSRLSIVRQPLVIKVQKAGFYAVNENHRIILRQSWLWQRFAYLKCGLHTLGSRYVHSPAAKSATIDGIIADIHAHRFRPDKLLLISGDHFNALFVRNMGVFYYPMLDTRIGSSEADWQHRQIVYVQTLAYALGVFQKRPIPVTTIVTTGVYAATCINIAERAYPSDALYGLLYALAALSGIEDANAAPELMPEQHILSTHQLATQLLDGYTSTLRTLYDHYRAHVFDDNTGLIRTSLHLSGAKDITIRSSAFYDNVIFWKTTQLAGKLGIIKDDPVFLDMLKERIVERFWLPERGYFLEDQSPEAVLHHYYSSDWLI